jgi:probable phosphoglycerate mutase
MRDLPEFYVLRHGETEWNVAGRFQGGLDSALTPRGAAQANAMGQALARLGVTTTHRWISSPAPRAIRTAELARGAPPDALDPRLTEIGMGDWSGLTRTDIDTRWPGPPDEDLMSFYARVPGGEQLAAVARRITALLTALDGPAVLVTHGITSRFLRGAVLGLPPQSLGTLPGGHGVIFRCTHGRVEEVARVDTLPDAAPGGICAT